MNPRSTRVFGSSNISFRDNLMQKTVKVLRSFARLYFPEIKTAKLGKEALAGRLAAALQDPKNAERFIDAMVSLEEFLYRYLCEIFEKDTVSLPLDTEKPAEAMTLSLFKDCIFFQCESHPYLTDFHLCSLPTEIRTFFRKYQNLCNAKRSPLKKIQEYIGAAVRLYGHLTPKEFEEIVQRYEPGLIQGMNDEQLQKLFHQGEKQFPIYLHIRPDVIHPSIYHFDDDTSKSIEKFLKIRFAESRWYPESPAAFRSFISDRNLCNATDRKALADFFQADGVQSDEICEDLINQMIELIQIGMHPKNLVCIVARIEGCEMEPDWQEELLEIFTRLEKTTRLMKYNGYTLEEMENLEKSGKVKDLARHHFRRDDQIEP